MEADYKLEDVHVGWMPPTWGYKRPLPMDVDVRLTWTDRKGSTVEHEEVEGLWVFAASGVVHSPSRSEFLSGGQNLDHLADLDKWAPGWSRPMTDDLLGWWQLLHLNDMEAGCAHQTVVWEDSTYGRRPALYDPKADTGTQPCPKTGYRYGTAWLMRTIPDDVVSEIRDFITSVNEGW